MQRTRVHLEVGAKRVFACAVDWPGWCRSAKTEDGALEALLDCAPRYAVRRLTWHVLDHAWEIEDKNLA